MTSKEIKCEFSRVGLFTNPIMKVDIIKEASSLMLLNFKLTLVGVLTN